MLPSSTSVTRPLPSLISRFRGARRASRGRGSLSRGLCRRAAACRRPAISPAICGLPPIPGTAGHGTEIRGWTPARFRGRWGRRGRKGCKVRRGFKGLKATRGRRVRKACRGTKAQPGTPGATGATGPANVLTVSGTTTGSPGSNANVTVAGTTPAQSLAFTIPRGDVGAQGTQGIQGPTGLPGPANVLTVSSTTTGAPGTNASVGISGTSPAQSLAFTIPRGDVGPQGPAGTFRLPRNYLSGLIVKNNSTDLANDLDIAAGICRSDDDSADIQLPSPITKQLDVAWAAGTAAGGRDTGAIADGSWHLFAIKNPTTGVADALFSLSISAPTMPSGFTLKRRIASVVRRTATLVQFTQIGDYFEFKSPVADISNAAFGPTETRVVPLLLVATGRKFQTNLYIRLANTSAAAAATIYDPDQNAPPVANIFTSAVGVTSGGTVIVYTRASDGAIIWLTSSAAAIHGCYVCCVGYWDTRDRDS